MDTKSKHQIPGDGIYLSGTPISHQAATGVRDGVRWIRVTTEIALRPGLAIYQQYLEPTDSSVKIEGNKVLSYPQLKENEPVTLKVTKFKVFNGQFIATKAELVS